LIVAGQQSLYQGSRLALQRDIVLPRRRTRVAGVDRLHQAVAADEKCGRPAIPPDISPHLCSIPSGTAYGAPIFINESSPTNPCIVNPNCGKAVGKRPPNNQS
jgi:hypothetical protein